MKCLPKSKIPNAKGTVLHDCHAEIVALRAFNRFLLDECALLAQDSLATSPFVERRGVDQIDAQSPQPFAIKDNVAIHMYCSQSPCGDASMELVMQAQEDATPWELPQSSREYSEGTSNSKAAEMKGRGHFSELGIVRRKPGNFNPSCIHKILTNVLGRSDAPLSLSKSCSDKLTLKFCISVLNSAASLLFAPDQAYIKTIVLPTSQYVPVAIERAFSQTGRMHALTPKVTASWPKGFSVRVPHIATTDIEFSFSKRSSSDKQKMKPSNVTAVYTPHIQETLIGGILQGRKQGDPHAASAISRKSMWRLFVDVAEVLGSPILLRSASLPSYGEFKASLALEARRRVLNEVKECALQGWIPNSGDEDFSLDE